MRDATVDVVLLSTRDPDLDRGERTPQRRRSSESKQSFQDFLSAS